jgi:hypothetical protein
VPLLEVCAAAGERNLLIIAPEVSDSALALLVINRDKGLFDEVMAAKAPRSASSATRSWPIWRPRPAGGPSAPTAATGSRR